MIVFMDVVFRKSSEHLFLSVPCSNRKKVKNIVPTKCGYDRYFWIATSTDVWKKKCFHLPLCPVSFQWNVVNIPSFILTSCLCSLFYKPSQYTLNTKWLCQRGSLISLPLGGGENWGRPSKIPCFMFACWHLRSRL